MITHIKLVGVCVRDPEQARDFYVKKLGFDVVADVPGPPEARWIAVGPPGAQTQLALWTPPGLEDRIGTPTGIVLRCEDIEAAYEDLRSRGVEFHEPPRRQPGGVMTAFADADDNVFVLRESRDAP